MLKARWLAFGLLVVFVVALASTTASEVSQAQGEKIYRLGMLSDLRTTNTMRINRTATVWESYVLGPRHCSLFTQTPTRFYYVPSLAAAVPYKPGTTELDFKTEGDFLTLTVDLKRGVKWSDGSDVTADDVVWSAYEAPTIFGGGDFVKGVNTLGGGWTFSLDPNVLVKVEKTGSHQVKYFFKGFSQRIQFAILFHSIFQKKYWEPKWRDSVGNREKLEGLATDDEPACGWAAFPEALKVAGKGWERGAFATNVANPNYFWKGVRVNERDAEGNYTEEKPGVYTYKQPVPAAAGPELARYETGPFIDRAAYRIFGDTASAVAALVRGDIEMLLNPLGADPGIRAQYRTEPRVKTADNKSHGMFYMSMNMRRKPFGSGPLQKDAKFRDDDIIGSRFRNAVNCLVDRDFVTQTLFQKVAFTLYSVISPANAFWFNEKVRAPCAEFSELTDPKTARAKKVAEATAILKSVGFTWVREPKADTATGAVTAGEGIINPVILGSADAAAGAAVAVPAGTIAVGAKVPLGTKATLTAGAVRVESDAAGKISFALPAGVTSVTLSAAGKVYFYGKGDATRDRVATFNFIYPNSAYDPRRALFGVQVEKWANQVGIPVRGVPTGFNVIVTKVFDEQDFDWWSLGWSLGTAALGAPTYLKDFYHTEHTDVGDDNAQGYSNPEVDKLIDAFLVERDLSRARAIVLQLQEVFAVDAPYLPWFDTVIVDAWRDDKVIFPFTERTNGIVGMAGMPALVRLR